MLHAGACVVCSKKRRWRVCCARTFWLTAPVVHLYLGKLVPFGTCVENYLFDFSNFFAVIRLNKISSIVRWVYKLSMSHVQGMFSDHTSPIIVRQNFNFLHRCTHINVVSILVLLRTPTKIWNVWRFCTKPY